MELKFIIIIVIAIALFLYWKNYELNNNVTYLKAKLIKSNMHEMSMKFTVPWQIRWPAVKTRSPRNGTFYSATQSAPCRSVLMEEDDLDHLGALHHDDIEQPPKRWWRK